MNRMVALASASALAFFSTPASAQSEGVKVAAKFGALESVAQASLSPDGNKVAFISEGNVGGVVFVADMIAGGQPQEVLRLGRSDGRLLGCSWAASSRLVCTAYYIFEETGTGLMSFTRQYAVDADGKNLVQLTAERTTNARGHYLEGGSVIDYDVPGKPGSVLMTRQFLADDIIGTRLGSSKTGLGVERVDTVTLKRATVEQPRETVVTYITDGHGDVRLLATIGSTSAGYMRGDTIYSYRKPGSRSWEPLSIYKESGAGFHPLRVDRERNVAYGFDDDGDVRALYSVALDGTGKRTKLVGQPGIDVDGLITIGRDDRVVGGSYATERRQAAYFDPELRALSQSLHKALPGQPMVDIVDASEGEKQLLIVASGDTAPGKFYRYDKATRELAEILPIRPSLEGTKLAEMRPITFAAADGTAIPGYLTLPPGGAAKNLPAIVMPHGGPSSRDEWGFDWLAQYFAARGFAVLQPNFRGSAGYGSEFFKRNGFQSWQTAIGDVNDAGRWLLSQGIAAPGKLAIVGWSYGGYAALQSAVLDPQLFKAIVAVAPVVDLASLKSDAMNYANGPIVARFVGDGPHVKDGSPAQNVERIVAPVLLFSGDRDLNVNVAQARMMKDRLEGAGKKVTYVEFPGLDHQIFDAVARTKLLSQSDAFLRTSLGLPAD